jgi:hypothetical protein
MSATAKHYLDELELLRREVEDGEAELVAARKAIRNILADDLPLEIATQLREFDERACAHIKQRRERLDMLTAEAFCMAGALH